MRVRLTSILIVFALVLVVWYGLTESLFVPVYGMGVLSGVLLIAFWLLYVESQRGGGQ